ncbi:MAG: hypothetical protein LIO62_03160 [Clostridiales bacterium]|nr:hypothetical protein [Clostridiales bacterium]
MILLVTFKEWKITVMKKFSTVILILFILIFMCPTTIFAQEIKVNKNIEYLDDGSYIVTEFNTNGASTFSTSTKNYAKSSSYYNSDDEKEWTVVLTGTFSYTGTSATCTKAVKSYTIYNDKWKVTSSSASKSGNKAIGDFVLKKYVLGVSVKTVDKTLTISCSKTGVCS